MAAGGNNNGSPSQGDSDRIEVLSEGDDTTSGSTNVHHSFPIVFENANKDRRPTIRPYASTSNRIVKKGGRSNVVTNKIPNKESRYIKDIGNTLLNTRWRWILLSLCIANGIAYVAYASLWMLVATINDDQDNDGSETRPCIMGANSFTGYIKLSMETISTIGYGSVFPTECQPSWMIMMLQALTGVAIEGALVTAVFVKMSRPYSKDPMSSFSKKAVVSLRDGVLCLIFRVRDIYGKHWAKSTIKAVLIKRRNSPEGEPLPYYFENLKLEKYGLMIWPQEIVHKITSDSPLWGMCPENMYKSRFEIMVILEGDSVITGQPSQSQTSYMNKEISWGYRFVPCVDYDKEEHKYVVQHEKFNDVQQFDTPLCSAQELSGLLNEALKPGDMWDFDLTSALSSPISRRSDNSLASVFKFPGYRMKKTDIDGINRETAYSRQFSGVTLQTINSEENLDISNSDFDNDHKPQKDEREPLSTNL